MTWVKLTDTFPEDPKIIAVGPLAGWLQVCGLAYCNRTLTDGFIPEAVAPRLAAVPDASITVLVEAGMWERVPGGYQIHDYLEYQPSKEKVLRDRAQAAKRQARRRHAVSNGVTDHGVSHGSSHGVSHGVSHADVTPVVTPTPTRPSSSKEEERVGGDAAAAAAANGPLAAAASFVARVFADYPVSEVLRDELTDRQWGPEKVRLTVEQADALIAAELENRSW